MSRNYDPSNTGQFSPVLNHASNSLNPNEMGRHFPYYCGKRVKDDRYFLARPLGTSMSSTVYLAIDLKQYAALKIFKANEQFSKAAANEVKLLLDINNRELHYGSSELIIRLLSNFTLDSRFGEHAALVYEPLGPSLDEIIGANPGGFAFDVVKRIIKQLLQALNFLHVKCKVTHADVKPENILVCAGKNYFDNICRNVVNEGEQIINVVSALCNLGRMHIDPIPSCDVLAGIDVHTINIKLGNFENGRLANHKQIETIQTRGYRAVEIIIGKTYDCSIDLWSTGCVFYELVTGKKLFEINVGSREHKNFQQLLQMTDLFGKIPIEIASSGIYFKNYFVETGRFKPNNEARNARKRNLVEELCVNSHMSQNELREIMSFLPLFFAYDTKSRPTAHDCLNQFF